MYIDNSLLHSDYENNALHLKEMVQQAILIMTDYRDNHAEGLDLFSSLDTLRCINDFSTYSGFEPITMQSYELKDPDSILDAIANYYTEYVFYILSNSFTHHFNKKKYEFTDEEYKTIQDTINQLRDDIQKSEIFGEDHKERLLKKLEELQKEFHQKMNRLDKFLGQVSSIGVALGKFGKDAKPMFDRVNETIKITNKVEERGDNVTPFENQIPYEEKSLLELKDE